MSKSRITWAITDHICRECSGRVLQSVSGTGATGGGNPLFRCADCGVCTAAMGPDCICWCGFQQRRGDGSSPYQCVHRDRAKDDKPMAEAMAVCGCSPSLMRGEVGIYQPDHYRRATATEVPQ